ncbi:hypothetical protein C6990_05630 [Nitrosopumilus sp. b3]|uniref:hypothetical protein n=1 Tax=Nitrosopumilus sp. b3 TaxID=2109909 RepID=UPI0015F69C49|nr:hypothetical protein [Nitrosopumilus sp. b3]KAF6247158.1 hypothetical protein C6990_05630 [Nitrosopumilus sp. b3]
MKDPHNYAQVGYAMIAVSASLAVIGLLALFLGADVLFSDNIQRHNTQHFNECKLNDFVPEDCVKYRDRINNEISGIYVDPEKWE